MPRFALVLALALVVSGGQLRAESFEDGLRAFRAGEPGRAHDIWLPLAGEGDASAQYSLGKLFEHGEGPIHQDLTKAVYWYESAAAQGLPAAQNNLALMFAQGRGVPNDLARAIELWRAAAEKSYPWAQYNLGLAYFRGQGVAVDQSEAAEWFRRAADGGLAEAQFIMGQLKREGLGLEKDEGQALAWYHRAAEQGHLRARKQANALKAEGIEPIPPNAKSAASKTADTKAAPKPKPKPKLKLEAKAAAKQPGADPGSSSKKGASKKPAEKKANPQDKAPAGKQTARAKPKANPKDEVKPEAKAEPEMSSKPETRKAATASEAKDTSTVQGKAKADEDKKDEGKKMAVAPEPLVKSRKVDDRSAPQTNLRSKPESAATQSAALIPNGSGSSMTETKNGYRVWLASAGSKAKATKLWQTVQDRHRDVLGGVEVDFAEVDLGGEALFRVLVGPLASAAEAERLCERLREAQPDAFCKVRAN